MKRIALLSLTLALLAAFAVVGCEGEEGPMEEAGEEVDKALEKAQEETGKAIEEAGEEMEEAGDAMQKEDTTDGNQ